MESIADRIYRLALAGIDITTITVVLRSEGIPDEQIQDGYQEVSTITETEIVRGQYYLVPIT